MPAEPALRAAARIGPYFAWEPWDGGEGWRPFTDLLDPGVVAERVGVARRTLAGFAGVETGAIGERVAASVQFLGLASRLLSPPLAAAAVGGALPEADPGRLWWRPVAGGPLPVAYRGLAATACSGLEAGDVAEALTRSATVGLVAPVLEVYRTRFSLSPKVLWGNVASALGGAITMIRTAAPAHAGRTVAIVDGMLARDPLRGTATLAHGRLTRHNCCLYYRIPGGGLCGDCVLASPRVRHAGRGYGHN